MTTAPPPDNLLTSDTDRDHQPSQPAASVHALAEYQQEYAQLVRWQQGAIIAYFVGPLLMVVGFALMYPFFALANILLLSITLPGFIALITAASLLVLVLGRKSALWQKVMDSDVDALAWSRPLDAPLRKTLMSCIALSAGFVAILIVAETVAHLQVQVKP